VIILTNDLVKLKKKRAKLTKTNSNSKIDGNVKKGNLKKGKSIGKGILDGFAEGCLSGAI